MEGDYEEDWKPPPELLRLVGQEGRELKPHQEDVEVIDLGEENEKKGGQDRHRDDERNTRAIVCFVKRIQEYFCLVLPRYAWVRP